MSEAYEKAKAKLENEIKKAKAKDFAEPILGHLIRRISQDEGLAGDILQEHKTWSKCYKYIYEEAKKIKKGNCVAVRDDVVYEWAEDYYRKDDKEEEEKKAQKEAERKKKEEAEDKTVVEKKTELPQEEPKPAPKPEPKPKKDSKQIEGQMSLFDLISGGNE